MAGFFGLFNYEKEGPGISKDAPKKKPFFAFFDIFFRNFWKFISINAVYCLCCIPVVTAGLANVGITNVTRNIARDKHSFGLSDFFETIKKNWKQGLIAGIINILISVVNAFAVYFYFFHRSSSKIGGITDVLGLAVCLFIAFVFAVMQYYLWTMIITFNLPLKKIYINSFKFVFINIKGNFVCFFSILLSYALFIGVLVLIGLANLPLAIVIVSMLAIIILPCLRFLIIQFCTFPAIRKYMIDPYYEEHPDDDIELRRNLGLEIKEKAEEEKNPEEQSEENTEDVKEIEQ